MTSPLAVILLAAALLLALGAGFAPWVVFGAAVIVELTGPALTRSDD